jgi:ubiquinone/menaquinone biosynthesis C-methylase UbiE
MSSDRERTADVVRHHWNRRAASFDHQSGHGLVSEQQRQAWLNLLSRLAGQTPLRLLDVGCGTGFMALRFAELGHDVTGIDLSPQMIDRARRKAEEDSLQIEFHVGDAAEVDSADEAYDLVVARHVIWNLPQPERGLAEWLRVLRRGGRLMLIEGKWADNDAVEITLRGRVLARIKDLAALLLHVGGHHTKHLNRTYNRLELELPFSGGPSAKVLAEFLEANSVHDVAIEPLMDPKLWGEGSPVKYPRYLATGTRSWHST